MKHWNDSELPDNALFPEQYTVRQVIRESAFSTLLLAYDALIEHDVIIKCFKSSAKGAYLREINATFDIAHENLVSCLNTFHRTDGVACIVYEYLAGGSLAALIKAQKTLPLPVIVACLHAMLNALCYLNSIRRIHCDIKPENILLRPRADGCVDYVLIDLGAACFLQEAQTGGYVTGTPAYIAPERIKNKFFFNSDLYSLGIIAFEMCTGKRPFVGTVEELTQANLSEIPSLEAIEPPQLRDFIDYLLVKNPQQRINSANLALLLLKKITLQGNQIAAPPVVHLTDKHYIHLMQLTVPVDEKEQPLAIHCFNVDNHPLVAFIYTNYVDMIDPLKPDAPFKSLFTTYPIQLLSSDVLAYATPSRIQMLNLRDNTEVTIKEGLSDLKKWHLEHNSLVWNNAYHRFYESLTTDNILKYGEPNYVFDSEVSVLADGRFVTSEGIANNKIVLRNRQAKVEQEWLLENPVIALSHDGNTLLVATMNLHTGSAYTLWCLAENQAVRQLILADNISQLACVNGMAFWLEDKKILRGCTISLQPKTLSTFTSPVFKFAVSYEHCFIVTYKQDDENRLFLTILKDRAVL